MDDDVFAAVAFASLDPALEKSGDFVKLPIWCCVWTMNDLICDESNSNDSAPGTPRVTSRSGKS